MLIPLFPLHVVLFPGAPLPVHVFEPRYRAMMAEVLAAPEPSFGVACIREGYEVGARAETHEVGCLAVVEQVRRHADGTIDLLARGSRRFRITRRPQDDPYPQAEVTFLEEPTGPASEEAKALARAALERYLAVAARLAGRDTPPQASLPDDPVAASYVAARSLAVETPKRQALLEAVSASDRLALLASTARSEASLLEAVGPPVHRTAVDRGSLN